MVKEEGSESTKQPQHTGNFLPRAEERVFGFFLFKFLK